MRFRICMGVAAVGCASVLTGGATAALASQAHNTAAHATSSTEPNCAPTQLSAGLHGSQAGLGNRGFILTLTNTGTTSCIIYGYPGLGLQNASHQVLPSHTTWGSTYFDTDPGRSAIDLSPGETASADFAFFSGTGGSTDAVATYLEVTPPNASTYLTVGLPGAPVRMYLGRLGVTAMSRHTPY